MNNIDPPKIETASVRVMRSHDYCHFEVVLGTSTESNGGKLLYAEIDELRKQAARLADKAVEQYKIARRVADRADYDTFRRHALLKQIDAIPEGERTPEQIAIVKKARDDAYWAKRAAYDYEDQAPNLDDEEPDEFKAKP